MDPLCSKKATQNGWLSVNEELTVLQHDETMNILGNNGSYVPQKGITHK